MSLNNLSSLRRSFSRLKQSLYNKLKKKDCFGRSSLAMTTYARGLIISVINAVILFSFNTISFSQIPFYIHKGLINTIGTLSAGRMTGIDVKNIYLHSELEYFAADRISLKGESDFFASSTSVEKPFEFNHASFTGIAFHFPLQKATYLDPFWAIGPGISYTKLNRSDDVPSVSNAALNPLISTAVGVSYYAKKIIYFSCNVRYLTGRHLSSGYTNANEKPVSLGELRFMFGLGLHFN